MSKTIIDRKEYPVLNECSQFSFTCYTDCKKCCEKSIVELSPRDIILLCNEKKISTTELHKNFTEFIFHSEKGIPVCVLKTTPSCAFHDGNKCTVYENRPFDCRTYPLAVEFSKEGNPSYYRTKDICPPREKDSLLVSEWLMSQDVKNEESYRFRWLRFFSNFNNSNRDDWFNQMFALFCYDFDQPIISNYCSITQKNMPSDANAKTEFVFQMLDDLFFKGMLDRVLKLGGIVVK